MSGNGGGAMAYDGIMAAVDAEIAAEEAKRKDEMWALFKQAMETEEGEIAFGKELGQASMVDRSGGKYEPLHPEAYARITPWSLFDAVKERGTKEDFDKLHGAVDLAMMTMSDEGGILPDGWPEVAMLENMWHSMAIRSAMVDAYGMKAIKEAYDPRNDVAVAVRGNTILQDGRDARVLPDPYDWMADARRRCLMGLRAADEMGGEHAEAFAAGSQSAVAPYAGRFAYGTMCTHTWSGAMGADFREDIHVLLGEEIARKQLDPVLASIAVDKGGVEGTPYGFRTENAAMLYLFDCVTSDTDFTSRSLRIECPDEQIRKDLEEALEKAKADAPTLDGLVGEGIEPRCPAKGLDAWMEDAKGEEREAAAAAERAARESGEVPVATVTLRGPDRSPGATSVAYSKEGLLAYAMDAVGPLVTDDCLGIRLADPKDYDLAYDVYTAVKEAQGQVPDEEDVYLVRYKATMARQSAMRKQAREMRGAAVDGRSGPSVPSPAQPEDAGPSNPCME